ncbi:MAG: class I SAM-dependent methyltransferase [Roseburia sp.]
MANYLEDYYVNYDEEGRLLSRHGQVEFRTTMKYIHEMSKLSNDFKILEIGAGTGRYSVALAKEGYSVDALELTEHNLEIMNLKIAGISNIRTYQGTATNLAMFEDESFDLTLLLGPMYHLYSQEDKRKALKEAERVTKTGGYIFVAFIMNDFVVINHGFRQGNLKEYLRTGRMNGKFEYAQIPEELFVFETVDSICDLEKNMNAIRMKLIATDGAANYMKEEIDSFDDETFELWMKYHLMNCERQDLIGATNHCLDILQKK